jgi:hypothetical protein
MQKMIYLLVSQHVSGIIMPIIRRTVQNNNAYGVQHWLCCSRLVEKRWFGVHLLGLVSRVVLQNNNTYGVQHWLCCSRLVEKRWLGVHLLGLVSRRDDARNMLRHQ